MKLWEPSEEQKQAAAITSFMADVERRFGAQISSYEALYDWSLEQPENFWIAVWRFGQVRAQKTWSRVLSHPDKMPGARWFDGAKLNFAENLLRYQDDHPAVIFWGEEKERRELSYAELFRATASFAQKLRQAGIAPGDRVAALVPNTPEAIIGMLATASLGAIWSSCSPDFGIEGIVDRFSQIEPRVLIAPDGYYYKGKIISTLEKAFALREKLPTLKEAFLISYTKHEDVLPAGFLPFASEEQSSERLLFTPMNFSDPLYIMFSSGTTGKPKCIVHSVGGVLLEHLKEHILHVNLQRKDKMFYQTTCGWMMWNWLVSALACGATVVLYDGFPLQRGGNILLDLVDKEGVTVFGTNAKFIALLEKMGLSPGLSHRLSALRTILSTGSPLLPESYDYVYEKIKKDLCLSSISGGTDILGCFALGSPMLPVYRGELQTRSLGMRVDVYNDEGQPVRNEKGELVCTAPFPSMPLSFWNDPDGERYQAAYFERFPGIWHHGDYVELNDRGGMVFYGRSDTVLNPGGVRIGTAEIYRQVEKLPEVAEAVVIGQRWNDDERVVLFVRLNEAQKLSPELKDKIQALIRSQCSPFHVPKVVAEVSDIPRTRSGKIAELAVKQAVHGEQIQNTTALSNPEALEQFRCHPALATTSQRSQSD